MIQLNGTRDDMCILQQTSRFAQNVRADIISAAYYRQDYSIKKVGGCSTLIRDKY